MLVLLALTAAQMCFSCSPGPADCSCFGPCTHKALFLRAPCGFQAATTSCANTAVQLECDDSSCTVERIAEVDVSAGGGQSCTVSVTLGDGTRHDFAVTIVGTVCPDEVTASVGDFTSATCAPARDALAGDGGLASDAASDAAEELP